MIPRISPLIEESDCPDYETNWKKILAGAFRTPESLADFLELSLEDLGLPTSRATGNPDMQAILQRFPVRVPRPFANRIEKGNPHDPLLRQVLPVWPETAESPNYFLDPLGEKAANALPGVLHKYASRALIVVNGSCPVHCRYCFRRHFPYAENRLPESEWPKIVQYLQSDPTINEVILSGGDPLTWSDAPLSQFCALLASVPNIKRIRIHTRFPVMIPQRVDAALLSWLSALSKPVIFVVHINHPNEVDAALVDALQGLRRAGVTVLNQSVLLAGINDHADTLTALSEAVFAAGALPYYLHLPDKVQGTAHFDVDTSAALRLMKAIQKRLPGFLLPRLVREVPGEASKTIIS